MEMSGIIDATTTEMPPTLTSTINLPKVKFTAANDLRLMSQSHPTITFWRTIDIAVSSFETLEIIPSAQRTTCLMDTVDIFSNVLENVQTRGKDKLANNAKAHLSSALKILSSLKDNANDEGKFAANLDTLRKITDAYPEYATEAKNLTLNRQFVQGAITGDNGRVDNVNTRLTEYQK